MNLEPRVLRALRWLGAAEVVREILQFFLGILLARLLTPDDFGLMVMVVALTTVADTLFKNAFVDSLIQRGARDELEWCTVYWLGISTSLLLSILLWILAPYVSYLFDDPRVVAILRAVAWNPTIVSLGYPHAARLKQDLRFHQLTLADLAGLVSGGVIAVIAAYLGAGPWSLVANLIAKASVTTISLWAIYPWLPSSSFASTHLRLMLPFAMSLQLSALLNTLSRHIDDILVGRYLGAEALGHYSRAYQLMLYPLQSVAWVMTPVLVVALCELRHDVPRFTTVYLQATRGVASLAFPCMIGLFILAPESISIAYGHQWSSTIPIVRILCWVGLVQSIYTTSGWIYLSQGRTDRMLLSTIMSLGLYLVAFFAGLPWGVPGVAIGYLVANLVLLPPGFRLCLPLAHLSTRALLLALRPIAVASVAMGASLSVLKLALIHLDVSDSWILMLCVPFGALTYCFALWIVDETHITTLRHLVMRQPAEMAVRALVDERPTPT